MTDILPEIKPFISHVLSFEDFTFSERIDIAFKDIGLLAGGRDLDKVITVVDEESSFCDSSTLNSFKISLDHNLDYTGLT